MTTDTHYLYLETGARNASLLLADLMRAQAAINPPDLFVLSVQTGTGSWRGVQSPMARLTIHADRQVPVFDYARSLARRFDQESVMYVRPREGGAYVREEFHSSNALPDAWTRFDGMGSRPFTFRTASPAERERSATYGLIHIHSL